MDSETQAFHKYLDRVHKIIEGASKKIKRTPVSFLKLNKTESIESDDAHGSSCCVIKASFHLLDKGFRYI